MFAYEIDIETQFWVCQNTEGETIFALVAVMLLGSNISQIRLCIVCYK